MKVAVYRRRIIPAAIVLAVGFVFLALPAYTEPIHSAEMTWGKCRGVFTDNTSRETNGLAHVYYAGYPDTDQFALGGLNMERLASGIVADDPRGSRFTPREDPCILTVESPKQIRLYWPAAGSQWGAECSMVFIGSDEGYLDLAFQMTFTQDFWTKAPFTPPLAGALFASYLGVNRVRAMYFYGIDRGKTDWIEFRGGTVDGDPMNIRANGLPPFQFEERCANRCCLETNRNTTYLLPLHYGLLDGDGDAGTPDDTLMYLLMFDNREAIQLGYAQWTNGKFGPALDWEFIITNPRKDVPYGFRARLVLKPFVSRDDVLAEYEKWRGPADLHALGLR